MRLILIQKGGLRSLRLLPLTGVLFVPLQGIASEKNWRFFEGLQNYMQNKIEGNEKKIMLGYLNCTMDKIDKNSENKTQKLYRCCSSYVLRKLIVDNGIEDLWRRENPDSPEFTCYNRSFTKDPG